MSHVASVNCTVTLGGGWVSGWELSEIVLSLKSCAAASFGLDW